MIIACAALYPYDDGIGELACLTVHTDYRSSGRGDSLLDAIEQRARRKGMKELFVLTTRTSHWFRERGFKNVEQSKLPVKKRDMYNYQRNAKVLVKAID